MLLRNDHPDSILQGNPTEGGGGGNDTIDGIDVIASISRTFLKIIFYFVKKFIQSEQMSSHRVFTGTIMEARSH